MKGVGLSPAVYWDFVQGFVKGWCTQLTTQYSSPWMFDSSCELDRSPVLRELLAIPNTDGIITVSWENVQYSIWSLGDAKGFHWTVYLLGFAM